MTEEFWLGSVLDVGWRDDRNIGKYQLLLGANIDSEQMMIIPLSRGVKDGRVTSGIIPIFLYVDQYWRHKYGSENEWLHWKHGRFKEKCGETAV